MATNPEKMEKIGKGDAISGRAREAMEQLNADAAPYHIWMRTYANAPAQRPWVEHAAGESLPDREPPPTMPSSQRVYAGQLKSRPHCWHWKEISPFLYRIAEIAKNADVPPTEFADRQQFLLCNPGLGGRLQVANTIRVAVSIYNAEDQAPVHLHTPNASRTILSSAGGYTTIEGERVPAARGDLILTPNGTWHDHGNDQGEPVVWMDVLDWPVMEFLDCIWLRDDYREGSQSPRIQSASTPTNYSNMLYGSGGLVPQFVAPVRGEGENVSPMFHYRGEATFETLDRLRDQEGSPYEGINVEFTNPVTGGPVFPTLSYGAQLLRRGEATLPCRHTSNTVYVVLKGSGHTEIAGQRLDWAENDIFVVPNFLWRRHVVSNAGDAILYSVTDAPLFRKIGQYAAQGKTADGEVVELA